MSVNINRNGSAGNIIFIFIIIVFLIRMCSSTSDNTPEKEHVDSFVESYHKRKALVLGIVNNELKGQVFDGYKFEDMEFKWSSDYLRHDYIIQTYNVKKDKLRKKEHSMYEITVELTNHTEVNGKTVDVERPQIVAIKPFSYK